MKRALIFVLLLPFIIGCSSTRTILSPYTEVPETCEAIDQKLIEYAEHDLRIFNLRYGKELGVTAIGVAASVGAIPPIWALAPTVAYQLKLGTYTDRIRYLAMAREIKGCPPLKITDTEVPNE
jgi:hypothetical protein